jgi:hypothetical protein
VNYDTGIINHKKPKSVTDKKLISLDNLMNLNPKFSANPRIENFTENH